MQYNADLRSDDLEDKRMQARIDLAAAHRLAVMEDYHEGIDNHFTLRVPGRPDSMYLNAFGFHWKEVTAGNLLEVSYDGKLLVGEGITDRSAVCIHAPLHRDIPGAECVLHTHMPYATALTQLEDMTLEMTGQSALYLVDMIAYDYEYNGFADVQEEGERMARVIGDKSILMLANHGVVVTGSSVAQAFHRLYFLERACRTQLFTMWTGMRRHVVPKNVIEKVKAQSLTPNPQLTMSGSAYHFNALKRILDKEQPDYKL